MRHRENEFRGRLGRLGDVPARKRTGEPRKLPTLDDVRGATDRGGVLVVERSVAELTSAETRDGLLRGLKRARLAAQNGERFDDDLLYLAELEGAVFVDTETTGLGGSMVFLLGAMSIRRDDIVVKQVFARDYREEPRLLASWAEMLRSARLLVSFNGKSFDLPVLRDRLGYHGMVSPEEPPHLDLLHASRRKWRDVLPDCRLQTLEWRVCRRRRAGDIPGDEIPLVYHRFVRTGERRDILTVFHHNALDLITLADLVVALADSRDSE